MILLIAASILTFSTIADTDSDISEIHCSGTGLAAIAPLASGIIAIPWGYENVLFLEEGFTGRNALLLLDEFTRCSAPSTHGNLAVLSFEQNGSDFVVLFSPDSVLEVIGPFENAGRPVFDNSGNIWFSADGYLCKNGISTGFEFSAYSLSVDPSGKMAAFCDAGDRICLFNIDDGSTSILASGYRFYNPVFVSCNETAMIISPTLEGEIVSVSLSDGMCTSLIRGSHPFWWAERQLILCSVTSDDGHSITAGDVWLLSPDGTERQISFSSDIHEIHPIAVDTAVYAIDAVTGSLIPVRAE